MEQAVSEGLETSRHVVGEFLTIEGERYYAIRNSDLMAPFFVSVISSADHWLFVSSNGGLTAGRVSPDTALFPYVPVDKIHDSDAHTGSKTIFRVSNAGGQRLWEPFNREHNGQYAIQRNLYKNVLGNKLCFEEINRDLGLAFRYTWNTSAEFGFVRRCELENIGDRSRHVDVLDGLRNILPAGTPLNSQTIASNLVDAYKWSELDSGTGLAIYAVYSGISDRAEPCESLKASVAYCLGIESQTVLLSSEQVDAFRAGADVYAEPHKRGIRGDYFVSSTAALKSGASQRWIIVADVEQSQSDVVQLRDRLGRSDGLADAIMSSIERGSDELARIMGAADGFQATAEEVVASHHYANTMFNVLRGGIFHDQYVVPADDLRASIRHFNVATYSRNAALLDSLPDEIAFSELMKLVADREDPQLERICYEYLPITFGRRHGDPSRPWNRFAIRLTDESGNKRLSYEGNWRDIFQNWEALALSFPEFIENIIAKFVNASTMDGYNPYRITKKGIDWEVEDPEDPWSYIGYWGDHQIIYLAKLLELSKSFHPQRLNELLHRSIFSYANVPYRIRPINALLEDPKNTVDYDHDTADWIDELVPRMGADGKLLLDATDNVYQVNLAEKLLVPLLSKLGNLVIDGGIWMNTQRPEWNDANNALVGNGLSMVTLYYMRRYVGLLQELFAKESGAIEVTAEVAHWLAETAIALQEIRATLASGRIGERQRYQLLLKLEHAASRQREAIYEQDRFWRKESVAADNVRAMLDAALAAIDYSIDTNRRDDGLYHAYNLMIVDNETLGVDTLYPMLEGQVAALSSGAIDGETACDLLDALFASGIYRPDQHSFMLYPDRDLPTFLEKNRIPADDLQAIPLLVRMVEEGDERIVDRDIEGTYRFNADFANAADLADRLDALAEVYGDDATRDREAILELYERVFVHRAFTGRSGGMFGFEGLGCVYWHMVSKLLLAVQERFFAARATGAAAGTCDRLGALYYRVRKGIGFNKTPLEFGAFPMDPYSHTPSHAGARQPGMTGQVKEEILTRFGELGVRVLDGAVNFEPVLLREQEFCKQPRTFSYLDVDDEWQELAVPAAGLAFTWCQVPILYQLGEKPSLTITWDDGGKDVLDSLALPQPASAELFARSGRVRQLSMTIPSSTLFGG